MQEFSRMLYAPTKLQKSKGLLQLWPRALLVTAPLSLGPPDVDTLGSGMRCQRAILQSKTLAVAGEAL